MPAPHQDMTITEQKALIAEAFAKGLNREGPKALLPVEASFLNQWLEDFDPTEVPGLNSTQTANLMMAHLRLGQKRKPKSEIITRLTAHMGEDGKKTGYDVLEVIQDDAPFIVESLIGELTERGLSIRSLFHPVLSLNRDEEGHTDLNDGAIRESFVLVLFDSVSEDKHAQICEGIELTLSDLRLAVLDFPRMVALLDQEINDLQTIAMRPSLGFDAAIIAEDIEFLRWMRENHFVFLGAKGYVYPRDESGDYAPEAPLNLLQEGFGVLRDVSRPVLRRGSEPAVLSKAMLAQIMTSQPVTVAKANLKSRVHRRAYMDYVGIKRYGDDGRPSGEIRFVGLFTSEAYDRPVFEVPQIRQKVARALKTALTEGHNTGAYNEKRLRNILESYPRDELFQMSSDDLLRISRGILHLADRPRVKLFARNDPFDRFISILMYLPRDLYQVSIQHKAGQVIAKAFGGRVSACYPHISDQILSCIHFIIGVTPGQHLLPDLTELEAEVEDVTRSWDQRLLAKAKDADLVPEDGQETQSADKDPDWQDWMNAYPAGYQERYSLDEALIDTHALNQLTPDKPIRLYAYRRAEQADNQFCFKLYHASEKVLPLSSVLPMLDHMGLSTIEEYGHHINTKSGQSLWVHEFIIAMPASIALTEDGFTALKDEFEATLLAIFEGRTESDGFNALCLLGQNWRQIALLRALCRYRLQSGLDPSEQTQTAALRENPGVAKALLALFALKFDPSGPPTSQREDAIKAACDTVEQGLRNVASLDHDRVLRRVFALIKALLRTNFYQLAQGKQPKAYISFKIASRDLDDLPEPKPYREIFVWSPVVEGVHLRFGPVARGGLRWSDRKDDFRTEVLGLVKAQQVKNAVIVPVGSKGGFYPKTLPRGAGNDAIRAEAIRAYKIFLSGLLDITDNLDAKGKIVYPKQTVIWDKPDPYLVVAADKGTATFSDIANSVSQDYGFWLGDAFASGGSVGYDHKVMGITARGAWEAIKRHFREMGKDIQSEAFSVAGVGDMSGDVFGNGMLLSPQTRLVAAFDHRDIFLDPNPDAAVSFKERARLFALARSSWNDYDKGLISKGGGVFSRSVKSIPITPEVKALLDISQDELSPYELMQAILKSRVELLYFGGIGTYIKSKSQSHLDVADKANDALRIDAQELRAQVIGEGANLGLTQAGRIEAAQHNVRLNTDAIDNSAGVDCSDHEVNIKILLGTLVAAGQLSLADRDALLADMTQEVAEHVLAHNYAQTLALSLLERRAANEIQVAQSFMVALEARGKLDRKVEGLPSLVELDERRLSGRGLTRPELAVLLAYAKIVLFEDLIASKAPDDEGFDKTLIDYFPTALHTHKEAIHGHRLQREIISTVLCNTMVNMAGPSFFLRAQRSAGVDIFAVALCFEAARRLFGLDALWARVGALDNVCKSDTQMQLYEEISDCARSQTYWLARNFGKQIKTLNEIIAPYQDKVSELFAISKSLFSTAETKRYQQRYDRFVAGGTPKPIAHEIALLRSFTPTTHVFDLCKDHQQPLSVTGRYYSLVGERFSLDRLREGASAQANSDEWDRLATRRLVEDLYAEQKNIVHLLLREAQDNPSAHLQSWCTQNARLIKPWDQMLQEIEQSSQQGRPVWSFAKLTIINASLREWVSKLL